VGYYSQTLAPRTRSPSSDGRSRGLAVAVSTLLVSLAVASAGSPAEASGGIYWLKKIAELAPTDPNSPSMMSYIRSHSSSNHIVLSGTSQSGQWGTPVYLSGGADPTYAIKNSCQQHRPPEFGSVRIPVGAKPDPTSDASMVVIDVGRAKEYGLWHAKFDRYTKTWSSCGGTVYYLTSNELAGTLKESNEPRNYGHRGLPPDIYAVTWTDIIGGRIAHMLRIAVDRTKCHHVFPMSGDECGTKDSSAPPEGAIIRIKQSVDVSKLGLSKFGLIIATALQTYGAVIGDQTAGPTELKVENTVAEGRGWLWNGVLSSTSLSKIPLSDYEIVKLGYGA